jgi:hypothetical protein
MSYSKIMEQTNTIQHSYEKEVPPGLHASIMKRVNHLKLRPLFFLVLALFVINLLMLTSHINGKLVEAEFMDMLRDLTEDSYFDSLALGILLERFFEIISFELVASVLLNAVGVFYISGKLATRTLQL